MKKSILFPILLLLLVVFTASLIVISGCGSATSGGGGGGGGVASIPRIYISDSTNKRVLILDPSSLETISSIELTGSTSPTWMTINPDGSKLYVADEGSNKIYVIDTNSNEVTGVVTVCSTPRGMDFNSDGSKLFVACSGGGDIAIVDTANNTYTDSAADTIFSGLGINLCGLTYSPATNRLYICSNGSSRVDMVTAEGNASVIASLTVPGAYDIAAAPGGHNIYVTAGHDAGTGCFLTSIEASTLTKVATWAASSPYGSFRNIAVSPNGLIVLAGDHDAAYIDYLHVDTGTTEGIGMGTFASEFRPSQIAISSDSSKAFVVESYTTREVIAVDLVTKQKIGALVLPTSGSYFGIAYKP